MSAPLAPRKLPDITPDNILFGIAIGATTPYALAALFKADCYGPRLARLRDMIAVMVERKELAMSPGDCHVLTIAPPATDEVP